MTFGKKALLGTVAALALAGQAHAITITNVSVGTGTAASIGTGSYTLASEIALTTAAPTGNLVFDVKPATGVLPSGNIVLTVNLTGGVFSSGVGGGAVAAVNTTSTATGTTACGPATSVLSSGGAAGSGTVVFLLSGLQGCGDQTDEAIRVTLPIRVTGELSAQAGLTTEAGLAVDGLPQTRSSIVTFASAFQPTITADTATTQLSILSGFKSFAGDNVLGTVRVTPSATASYSDLSSTPANVAANVTSVTIRVSGDFTGYGTGTGNASLLINSLPATIVGGTATVTATGGAAALFASAARDITITTDASVLNASAYTGSITASYSTAAGFSTATESVSAALDSVVREGTTIVFPWTASSGTVAASGSNNVIRVGNRSGTAITGLYARVVNSSAAGYTNPGLVSLAPLTIPANGETIIDSSALTSKLGEFGRGDIEIVIEANPNSLTTRRLVVRPDGVFDWRAGAN